MPVFSNSDNVKQLLLNAVNTIEKTDIKLSEIIFSTPEPNSTVDPLRNTKISFAFNQLSGKSGIRWIYYNRLHKSALPTLSIARTTETTVHQVLPILVSTFGLPLTTDDVEDELIPGTDSNVVIDLNIKSSSLVFYDDTEIITTGVLPVYIKPPANLELSTYCDGFTKIGRYTDGYGGEYTKVIEFYSGECGFTGTTSIPLTTTLPPATTSTLPPTTTTIAPTTTSPPTTTTAVTPSTTVTTSTSTSTIAPTTTLVSSTTASPSTTSTPTTLTSTPSPTTSTLSPSTTTAPTTTIITSSTTVPPSTTEPPITTTPSPTTTTPVTTIAPAQVVIDNDIWLALSFENSSFTDLSFSGRIPTLQTGITFESGSRTGNLMAVADDISDRLNYSVNLADLNGLSGVTFEFDIYIPDSVYSGYFFGTDGTRYAYISPNGSDRVIDFQGWLTGQNPGVTVPTNSNTHVALILDASGSEYRTYVNGILNELQTFAFTLDYPNAFIDLGIFNIGTRDDLGCSQIKIDNLIITKYVKYSSNFVPHSGIVEPPVTTTPAPTTTVPPTTTSAPTTTVTTTIVTTSAPTTSVVTTTTLTPTTTAVTTLPPGSIITDLNFNVLISSITSNDLNLNQLL